MSLRKVLANAGFVLALCTASGGASAHHSFAAEFDINEPVLLTGVVSEVEFINPHSWIHIDVTNEDGSVERWSIEGGTPNTLFRSGINRQTLAIGTAVTVDGYRARDGSNKASGRDITLSDGSKLFLDGSAPRRDN